MADLSFRRVATRTGGEVNNNTLHHLNAMVDYLTEITLANRLSGHGLTLNSTEEGQQILALVQALARAEERLLQKLLEVGGAARNQSLQQGNVRIAPRPAQTALPPVRKPTRQTTALPAPKSASKPTSFIGRITGRG